MSSADVDKARQLLKDAGSEYLSTFGKSENTTKQILAACLHLVKALDALEQQFAGHGHATEVGISGVPRDLR